MVKASRVDSYACSTERMLKSFNRVLHKQPSFSYYRSPRKHPRIQAVRHRLKASANQINGVATSASEEIEDREERQEPISVCCRRLGKWKRLAFYFHSSDV